MNELIETYQGEVDIPKPICPIVPFDIRCKEFNYTTEKDGKRHITAKCGDGSSLDYPDISPLYPSYEQIPEDENGNTINISFVQNKEDTNNLSMFIFDSFGFF